MSGIPISRAAVGASIDEWLVHLLQRRIHARVRLVEERELQSTFQSALQLLDDRIGQHEIGDYLEFGVYNGTSLLCMYRALEDMNLRHVRLIGFDSFRGLPRDAEGFWRSGDFKASRTFTEAVLSLHRIDWSRLQLVEGWFKDTLQMSAHHHGINSAGVIMIDCDLFDSAREALHFVGPLIKREAVIVFDDWHTGSVEGNAGERRAFRDFLDANPHLSASHLDHLSRYSDRAAVFLVTNSERATTTFASRINSDRRDVPDGGSSS